MLLLSDFVVVDDDEDEEDYTLLRPPRPQSLQAAAAVLEQKQTRQKAEARKSGQTFAPAVNRSTFQDVFKTLKPGSILLGALINKHYLVCNGS